jgi:hypothetical protein
LGLFDGRAQLGAKQVLNRFIFRVAEKLSGLRPASYFRERAARADVAKALDLLDRAGDAPPREGDEIAG